jgi:hypothetical protein
MLLIKIGMIAAFLMDALSRSLLGSPHGLLVKLWGLFFLGSSGIISDGNKTNAECGLQNADLGPRIEWML